MIRSSQRFVREWLRNAKASALSGRILSESTSISVIPESSIASRALMTVIAIMTFLATITAGGAILIRQSAVQWGSQIAQEITIQIKPIGGRNIDDDVIAANDLLRSFPGIVSLRAFNRAESSKMLEPWLGSAIGFDELPIPRLIAVKPGPGGLRMDILAQKLREMSLPAVVDDHRLWRDRLASMTNGLMVVAFLILALVISAMMLAIAFATRGAMAGTKDIIDIMHFVGAHDRYISHQFQTHFFRLGLKGAALGSINAVLFILVVGYLAHTEMSGPDAEQITALFGSFSLGWLSLVFLASISFLIAFLVGRVSHFVVYRQLRLLR